MKQSITLLIADDHPLFRSGVRTELEQSKDFAILAETGNGEEALQLIKQLNPDVAIVDFQMPIMTGLELAKQVEASGVTTKVILLTMHRDHKIFFAALEAGVSGYVLKDDAVEDIAHAIRQVIGGENFISHAMIGLLVQQSKKKTSDEHGAKILDTVTLAERHVMALIAQLKTNDEIAKELFISKRTVENHKASLAGKLGLSSSKNLLRFVLQHKEIL
jgi:DNA-binding NarL/FixJ family response regulator